MADKTTHYELAKFSPGQPGWGDAMNSNLDAIDSAVADNAAAVVVETSRATSAEETNATAISAETSRAQAVEATCEKTANKGTANGYPNLDSTGHIPINQIPTALQSAVYFAGLWNAATNTPTLTSGQGYLGQCYKVSVAGSSAVDGISVWHVGDWVVYDGSAWDKIDNFEAVTSVQGRVGAVTITPSDLGLAPVATSGAYADLTGKPVLAASATTDTTNASNITSGTLPDAQLSGNIPRLSSANTLTGNLTVNTNNGSTNVNITSNGSITANTDVFIGNAIGFTAKNLYLAATTINSASSLYTMDAGGSNLVPLAASLIGLGATKTAVDTGISRSAAGVVAVGNGTAGNASGTLKAAKINLALTTPASSAATGNAGDMVYDANYVYICTATNTWKRVALTSF